MTTDNDNYSVNNQVLQVVSYDRLVTTIFLYLLGTECTKTFEDFKSANFPRIGSDRVFRRENFLFCNVLEIFKEKTWEKLLSGKKALTLKQLGKVFERMHISESLFFELIDTTRYYLLSRNIVTISKNLKSSKLLNIYETFKYGQDNKFLNLALEYNFHDDTGMKADTTGFKNRLLVLTPLPVEFVYNVLLESELASDFLEDLEALAESESLDDDDAWEENCDDLDCHCKDNEDHDSEDDNFDFDDGCDCDDQDADADESSKRLDLESRITNLEQLRAWIDSLNRNSRDEAESTSELDRQMQNQESEQAVNEALSDLLSVFIPQATEQEELDLDKRDPRDAFGFRVSELQKLAKTIRDEKRTRLERLATEILEDEIDLNDEQEQVHPTSIYEYEQDSTAFDFLRSSGWFKTFADTYLEQLGASAEGLDAQKKAQEQQKFMEDYSARLLETFFKKPKI